MMLIRIFIIGILMFSQESLEAKTISFNSLKDFSQFDIGNNKIQNLGHGKYGITFNTKQLLEEKALDLFLSFDKSQAQKDDTSHYEISTFQFLNNPDYRFKNTASAGFIKPDHKIIIKVNKDNYLANSKDLGSLSIDFYICPLILYPENILLKKGIYYDDKFYGIVIAIINKKIKVSFHNMFYDEGGNTFSRELSSQKNIKAQKWQHLAFQYNRIHGKMSLFIDGVLDNENLPDLKQVSAIPHFHKYDGSDLILFENLKAYVDNFRILKNTETDYKNYINSTGEQFTITSPVIDFNFVNSTLTSLVFSMDNLEQGMIQLWMKYGNKQDDIKTMEWKEVKNYQEKKDQIILTDMIKMRYLQMRLSMTRNTASQLIPVLFSCVIQYDENTPPLAPVRVWIDKLGESALKISWDKNFEENVQGYVLFWGHEPKQYENELDIGPTNSCVLQAVDKNENYYFAVKAYNSREPYNFSTFSKEAFIFFK